MKDELMDLKEVRKTTLRKMADFDAHLWNDALKSGTNPFVEFTRFYFSNYFTKIPTQGYEESILEPTPITEDSHTFNESPMEIPEELEIDRYVLIDDVEERLVVKFTKAEIMTAIRLTSNHLSGTEHEPNEEATRVSEKVLDGGGTKNNPPHL
mgnify:CR=1 FL=1